MIISFFVPGKPQPGGSKKAFIHRSTGRVIVKDDNDNAFNWKQDVKKFAVDAYKGVPMGGPLRVTVTFVRPRPRSHYGTGKKADMVKPSAPEFPIVKPDTTKLWRSTEDALTGIIWKDDAQVVDQFTKKRYGPRPGAEITIEEIT